MYKKMKVPYQLWEGKILENWIWTIAGFRIPDLIDGNVATEAKGGLPPSQKIRTALGQPTERLQNIKEA